MKNETKLKILFLLIVASLTMLNAYAQKPAYHKYGVKIDTVIVFEGDTIFGIAADTTERGSSISQYHLVTEAYLKHWNAGLPNWKPEQLSALIWDSDSGKYTFARMDSSIFKTTYVPTSGIYALGYDSDSANQVVFMQLQQPVSNSVVIDISSAQILSGVDSLPVLSPPGAGKCYSVINVSFYYNYNTTAYTSGGSCYLRTWYNSNYKNLYSFGNSSILDATRDEVYYLSVSGDEKILKINNGRSDLNSPLWFYLPAFSTGDGEAKLFVEYCIIDFN